MNNRWEDRYGNCEVRNLTVTVTDSDDVFELCFKEEDLTWWIENVKMPG